MSEKIVAVYVGQGQGHYGIPGRDLTEADWTRLTADQQRIVKYSRLYEIKSSKKPKAESGKGG